MNEDQSANVADKQISRKSVQTSSGTSRGEYVRRAGPGPTPGAFGPGAPVEPAVPAEPAVPLVPAVPVEPRRTEYVRRQTVRVERAGPSQAEYARRITTFVAGIIQALVGLRILFLLLDAQRSNGLVAAIINLSQLFVAPFQGILRTNALSAGGSTLDLAAIIALIGWTLLEVLILAGIEIFRREPSAV